MSPRLRVALLVALSVAVRLGLAAVTQAIHSDGPEYVRVAERYAAGDFDGALAHPYHPLYPLLLALARAVVADWEWAGMLVSALLGGAAVVPLWLSARRVFGEDGATAAGLLFALHPYAAELSAAVLTTGTYLFFALWAMELADRAVRGGSATWTFAAGICAGAAYLTRPDGLLLYPAAGIAVSVALILGRGVPGFSRRFLLHAGALATAFVLVAFPYQLALREAAGHWVWTGKMSSTQLLPRVIEEFHVDTIPSDHQQRIQAWFATPVLQRVPVAAARLAWETTRALHLPALLLPLGLWAWWRRRAGDRWRSGGALLVFPLVLLSALLYFSVTQGRESKRYTTPIAALLLVWSGGGAVALAGLLTRRSRGEADPSPAVRDTLGTPPPSADAASPTARALAGVLSVAAVLLAVFALRVPGKEKAGERLAGVWIRARAAAAVPRILTRMDRVVFYAGGEYLAVTSNHRLDGDSLVRRIRAEQVQYVVIDYHIDSVFPEFDAWMENAGKDHLRLVYETSKLTARPDRKDNILVYEVLPRH